MSRSRFVSVLAALSVGVLPASAQGSAQPIPIPQGRGADAVQKFFGGVAQPSPIATRPIPDNPFMSPGSWSGIHGDTYASDTYFMSGALGRTPIVSSTWLGPPDSPVGLPVVITWDRAGRIVAGTIKVDLATSKAYVQLTLIEPNSLRTLATFKLPGETMPPGSGFRPAGTYFYQDQRDRIVTGTPGRTVWVVSHSGSSFTLERKYELTSAIDKDDSIEALQPDFSGRLWFTSKHGVVGTLDMKSGKLLGKHQMPDDERIVNGHAAGENGGVFIVSTKAMYRFDANPAGAPKVTWRETYEHGKKVKPGQVDIGSGTTPTLMGAKYVAITDNAEPRMHVLVYRRAKKVTGPRLTCSKPVFGDHKGSNENSLVATENSIIVENNFGYKGPTTTTGGHTTTPGISRIDLNPDGSCRTVWTNDSVSIPSVVTKMSVANGLIYSYTKPKGPGTFDPWYFTALDFRTGDVVYKQLAGTGLLYNNHYSGLYLGPNGTVYVGVLGGIVAMHDSRLAGSARAEPTAGP